MAGSSGIDSKGVRGTDAYRGIEMGESGELLEIVLDASGICSDGAAGASRGIVVEVAIEDGEPTGDCGLDL